MLENLHHIDWENLQGAYSSAKNVPELIEALISQSTEETIQALFGLANTVFHQGSIYPATAYVIPFLLDLLQDPQVICRARILELLGFMASVPAPTHKITNDAEREHHTIVKNTHDEIIKGKTIYSNLLTDANPSLRLAAVYILTQLIKIGEDRAISVLLQNQMQHEADSLVKAGLIFALCEITQATKSDTIPLKEDLISDPSYQMRFAAIITLIRLENQVRPTFIDFLVDAVINYETVRQAFLTPANNEDNQFHPLQRGLFNNYSSSLVSHFNDNVRFPWMVYCTRSELVRCLTKITQNLIPQVKPAFVHLLNTMTSHNIETIGIPILRFILQLEHQEKFSVQTCSQSQTDYLQVIYDNIHLWNSSNASPEHTFKLLGLPTTRKEWAEMLKIDTSTPMSSEQIEEILHRLACYYLHKPNATEPLTTEDYAQVKTLQLRNFGNDSFVPFLHKFTGLTTLDISTTDFTSEGIIQLPFFPQLRDFQLPNITLTEDAVRYIGNHHTLETLNVSNTDFQEAWLSYLQSLKNLKRLFIRSKNLTEDSIQALHKHLPNCKIWS